MLIVIGIILIIIGGFLVIILKRQSAPKNYWKNIFSNSQSQIEKKYNRLGKYKVVKKKYTAIQDNRDKKDNYYVVWYPQESGIYPLVIMVNGTGISCDKYEAVFKHFASWGYVVVGNNYGTNWDGKHAADTLDFVLNTQEIVEKVNVNKIAIGGHSQGGMGAFNAVVEYENGNKYKVLFSLSPTNRDLGISLQWGFDLDSTNGYAYKPGKIKIPTILIAGTGKFDKDIVIPLKQMKQICDELEGDKIMFRRSDGIDHGDILYEANGYIIAGLDYYLKDVQENKNIFFGKDPEIIKNSRYQDYQAQEM
ncbi:MAG: alpha/beta hydrolase family protein [Thomasclavelia sp.]